MFLISPLGGPERKVLDWTQFNDYCWSADARRLIFSTNTSSPTLQTLDVQNGAMQQIAEVPFLQKPGTGGLALAVSLDGELIATGETDPLSRDARIVVRRLDAAAAEQATIPFGPGGSFLGIQFLPGRQGIIYAAGISPDSVRLYHSALDGSRGERLPDTDYPALFPTLSANGDRLAFMRTTGDDNLYKLPLAGPGEAAREPEPFAHSSTGARPTRTSRGMVAKSRSAPAARVLRKYIRRTAPDITSLHCLTSMRSVVGGSPRFSPDGKWIVFDSRPSGGQSDIFVMPAAGGLPRNLSNHPATDSAPTWSRDGQFIYFHSDRSGSSQVWKMRADGTNPAQITRDGGFIAYRVDRWRSHLLLQGRYIYQQSLDSRIERRT